MRVITWNMRRATNKRHEPWDYFNERSPDLAILQEVTSIPEDLENNYDQIYQRALGKTGREQAFGNAILVKNGQLSETKLLSEKHWINVELNNLGGHLLSAKAQVHSGIHFNVLAIHSPAWAIDKERLKEMDVSDVKLAQNPDIWGTEILWSVLKNQDLSKGNWIVTGDLNSSETFDYMWSRGPRGNKEILDRMKALGLIEMLRYRKGKLEPTFRNTTGGRVIHQLDHLFVGHKLIDSLMGCGRKVQDF